MSNLGCPGTSAETWNRLRDEINDFEEKIGEISEIKSEKKRELNTTNAKIGSLEV